jgi:uncharacterized protein YnzC (UPF0291/DUF896 family)
MKSENLTKGGKRQKKNFRNEYLKDIIMVEFQYLVVIVKKIASIQNSMNISKFMNIMKQFEITAK